MCRPTLPINYFIERSNKIYNNKYDYSLSKYKNMHTKISIICPIHGHFIKSPAQHLRGQGCKKCSQGSTETFIEKAKLIHNNFYDYSHVNYTGANNKVKIICPIHGEFLQKPSSHVNQECGCYKCGKFGLSRATWIRKAEKNNLAIFYILECFNSNERFIKVGITSKSFKNRYTSNHSIPYQYTILKIIESTPQIIWNMENKIKKEYVNFSYSPKINFQGKTECFSTDIIKLLDL
jgi:hypothetical protein